MTAPFDGLTPDAGGLVPAVIQDASDGTVLMVGYMNREAYDTTVASGFVHFWSRSRDALWKKGETSGNTLSLVSMAPDCDSDTLLVSAVPAGPTCHTGATSCFGGRRESLGAIIDTLTEVVASRLDDPDSASYTSKLLSDSDLAARKVLEEAGEVAFASKDLTAGRDSAEHVAEEAADVIYHLLALLGAVGVDPTTVADVLRQRRR